MLNTFISTEHMTKETWKTYRRQGIGGSDVSAICGISKYKSAFQLWAEKTGNAYENEEQSESSYWGNVLEPLIVDEFVRRTNLTVTSVPAILQHPEHKFMLANLDGIVNTDYEDYVLEIKTANAYTADEWLSGNIPYEYLLQVQHYLSVTDLLAAYIVVLIGGNQFRYYFVERDEEIISMLIEIEKQFWSYVENNIIPPIDGSNAAREYINSLFPRSTIGKSIILNDSCLKLVDDFENYQAQEDHYKGLKEKAGNELKLLIGDNEIAKIADRVITWKSVEQERLDTKRLEAEQLNIYEKYLKKSSYRRFTIKSLKGE